MELPEHGRHVDRHGVHAVTVTEALRDATSQARAHKYSADMLRAVRIVGDVFPWMTPDEMRRERQGLCRDLAIFTIDTAYRLCPGAYFLVIGDTADPDADPDHAWVEAVDETGARWWSDPTNRDGIDKPRWFSSFTPQRFYRFALTAEGKGQFVAKELMSA